MEDSLRKLFPTIPLRFHEWISYEDRGHARAAEPDCFADMGEWVFLAEFKLTGSRYGRLQCLDFYVPLLEALFSKPVFSLQICKQLTPETPGPFVYSVEDFLASPQPYATYQWLR